MAFVYVNNGCCEQCSLKITTLTAKILQTKCRIKDDKSLLAIAFWTRLL